MPMPAKNDGEVPPGSAASEPQYNPLFSVFTDERHSSSRISGLIAYALYKEAKVRVGD
jgi:hypothetical protein